ncbi:MAG: hypothetical protein WDW38_005713 [Sanguina aurantia]
MQEGVEIPLTWEQALMAMFPEPGTVCLSVSELDALRFARVLLEGGCSSCSVADAVPISGAIRQVTNSHATLGCASRLTANPSGHTLKRRRPVAAAPSAPRPRLHGLTLCGEPLRLRFSLPNTYPASTPPLLSIECGAPREAHQRLTDAATECAAECAAGGELCLLMVLEALREEAEQLMELERQEAEQEQARRDEHHDDDKTDGSASLSRALVWFHHIKSLMKRKKIVEWARDLKLGGACKPGFPGVVVVEGASHNVQEFLQSVRGLSWQAMQVRSTQEVPLLPPRHTTSPQSQPPALPTRPHSVSSLEGACSIGPSPSVPVSDSQVESGCASPGSVKVPDRPTKEDLEALLSAARALPKSFCEFPESGMSALGSMCREAGLESLFLTAMKL